MLYSAGALSALEVDGAEHAVAGCHPPSQKRSDALDTTDATNRVKFPLRREESAASVCRRSSASSCAGVDSTPATTGSMSTRTELVASVTAASPLTSTREGVATPSAPRVSAAKKGVKLVAAAGSARLRRRVRRRPSVVKSSALVGAGEGCKLGAAVLGAREGEMEGAAEG